MQSLGFSGVTTLLQSGNVVFKADEPDLDAVSQRIGEAIEAAFGFRPSIILRTLPELRAIIAANPFGTPPGLDPAKLLVLFLAASPSEAACTKLREMPAAPEDLRMGSRELYIYFPDGIGRSKLSMAAIERILKTPGTGRNWNTAAKLLTLAETLSAPQ